MRPRGVSTAPRRSVDEGSAVADFALVSALLAASFLAVAQLVVAVHVRNTMAAAAAEGARVAAQADRGLRDGEARTRELLAGSLPRSLRPVVTARYVTERAGALVEVTVTTSLPLLGLTGPDGGLTVSAHALREGG
jgi:hypothetical protein